MNVLTNYKSRFKILKGGKIALVLSAIVCSTTLYAGSMDFLGSDMSANGVSSDGTTVVGRNFNTNSAYYWTSEGGFVDIGTLGGSYAGATGISDDKSIIVGFSYTAGFNQLAFIWTEAGGMVSLGDLAGGSTSSAAKAISGDGTTVVGHSSSAASGIYEESFRWTSGTGMVSLGTLAGGSYDSSAEGVSYDGSVIVGFAKNASSNSEAYRWTSGTGMVGLGFLAGGNYSRAYDVSNDGSVVVGYSGNADGYTEAIRWEGGTMTGLGILSGDVESSAYAVSSDGSVVVGYSNSAADVSTAFRWTEAKGMQSIAQWLADSGYTVSGWRDTVAYGVSDDGNVIVGSGTGPDGSGAFIARWNSGIISVESFNNSLQSAGSVTAQGVSATNTIMHGAHGHPGAKRALDDKRSMWVAGDITHDDRHDSKDNFEVAEVGVSYRVNDNTTFSGAIGKTWGTSSLLYGGSSRSRGQYLAIDTDIQLPTLPLYVTLTYLNAKNSITIKRGYNNGGSNDASYGNTKQTIQALRARLQWQEAKKTYKFSVHPYIEGNVAKISTDAYTETGGGFPVIYNSNYETVHDFRFGADADYTLNKNNRLILTLEGVHRLEKKGKGASGKIIGLNSFTTNGRSYDQNWARGTVGYEHKMGIGKVTVTLNGSTEGEDPKYWAGFNYSMPF